MAPRPRSRFALAACLAAAGACGSEPPLGPITDLPRALTQAEVRVVESGNRFAFALLSEAVFTSPADANVFLSPLSIMMALGMTANGAQGPALDSLLRTLRLQGMPLADLNASARALIDLLRGLDPRVQFTLANSIWHDHGFPVAPAFLDANRRFYDAEVRALDFASPSAGGVINGWVSSRTSGRIPAIVPAALPPEAVVYVVNAIWFKAAWRQRFDAARTQDEPFQLAGGGSVSVPMMHTAGEVRVLGYNDPLVRILDLAYGGGAWRATFILPSGGTDIARLATGLDRTLWNGWMAILFDDSVRVALPRFTVRYTLDSANGILKQLGSRIAYCDEANPARDFTPMVANGAQNPCITDVRHRTFVEVNEEGTEAAAATSVGVGVTSGPQEFRVDRPFIFAIRERLSGAILFIGLIRNPTTTH